jgi:ectoine hydroxylase-related dioxygenase (phytanoyl-CoA dioxygenase family)
MDKACLEHTLTAEERGQFEENGYLIVKNVLPPDLVADLTRAADRIDAEHTANAGGHEHASRNHFDFIGKDPLFLELLDWAKTFPKVWDILGWHIQLYHSHFIVTPPIPPGQKPKRQRLGWHQDSGRLNIDLETEPQPRISLKVAYFLTDCIEPHYGNFHAVPGSHRQNRVEMPADENLDPQGAVPIQVAAGDAVYFDRRLWHAGGHNRSQITRKVLFYGYSYRWLKPRDDMTVAHYMARCDPIRRQLLGDGPSGSHGFTSPKPQDIPLQAWLVEHLGEEVVVR